MNRAVSVVFWTVGIFLTVVLFFAMLFFSVALFFSDKKRKLPHAQCYWWTYILTNINPFWKLRINGLENIDKRKTYVIVSNHQSLADIIILYKIRTQFKWVAKDSLFKVPIIGWCLSLARHIKLVRGNLSSIKKAYREAAQWLREDVSVLFFPEGTRGTDDKMNEFFNGAFKLAIKEKRPVLPIVLSGTGNAIPRGSWLFKSRVTCGINVLPSIDTDSLATADFEYLKNVTWTRMTEATRI